MRIVFVIICVIMILTLVFCSLLVGANGVKLILEHQTSLAILHFLFVVLLLALAIEVGVFMYLIMTD